MIKQTEATFQVVISQASLADSIKLLPWCVSAAVSLHYVNGMMAPAMPQDEDVPAASKPEGSPALGPSSSPVHPSRTPPLPVPPLQDIPLVGTPPVGHSFAEDLAISTKKRSKLGVNTALHRVMRTCLN